MIIKKCMKCGAIVDVLKDCNCEDCGILCCGEAMKTFFPNSEDASVEKHLPVINILDKEIEVVVPHVMENEHFIEWIAVECNDLIVRKMLKIGEDAKARFPYVSGSKVYSYCNKHGLWSTEVKKNQKELNF